MIHLPRILVPVAVAGLLAVSCGSGKKSSDDPQSPETAVQTDELDEALNAGDIRHASAVADSMSLFVDDFTPEQTVSVLTTFLTIHNEAQARHESRRDLETIRKFIDVYDIALSVNPKDTRAAFAKAHRKNPEIDFDSIAKSFRRRLAGYDASHDGSAAEAEPADTITTDTVTEEIPIELRPAE